MRHGLYAIVTAALLTSACARPKPLTTDVREELGASGNLGELELSVIETFELRSGGRSTIVVKNWTKAIASSMPDDTTIVLDVLGALVTGARDTLHLTFARATTGGSGAYTLRKVNGAWLGTSIPIAGVSYQYHPCYQNVGSKCDEPIPTGAREDQLVRVGITR
jgi:hypothetical protein